jgi:hypothetical protein
VNFLKNNFLLLINNNKLKGIIVGWFFVELAQKTKYASVYLVMHLSSFFGAFIFLYLIDYYKKSKWLKITPIFIEIIHSLCFLGAIDYEDVLFSVFGMTTYYIMFSNRKSFKMN